MYNTLSNLIIAIITNEEFQPKIISTPTYVHNSTISKKRYIQKHQEETTTAYLASE
jgi:hypothetical protein